MKSNILIVDDNYLSAKTLALAVSGWGYGVHIALDGTSAVKMSHSFVPDVVLLDLGMPAMNGYETCLTMREDRRLKDTLFIAQTGLGTEATSNLTTLAGFHYHLVKPLDMGQLKSLLAKQTARISRKQRSA